MAKMSAELQDDHFEIKGEDVFKVLLRYREIRENLHPKGGDDESEAESNVSLSDAEVDIVGITDEEKSDTESTTSKECYSSQKYCLGSFVTPFQCTYKGCGKSLKNPASLAQHTHQHAIEELRKVLCKKSEETQPNTNESQECKDGTSCDVDRSDFKGICNNQRPKKRKFDADELEDSSGDENYLDTIPANDEEDNGASVVSTEGQISQKCKKFKVPHGGDSSKPKKRKFDANELEDSSGDENYIDTIFASDEKDNDASVVSIEGQNSQKCMKFKASHGRGSSIHVEPHKDRHKVSSTPSQLPQHIHSQEGEEPKKRLCGKSEDTELETNEPQECSFNTSSDNEVCVTDDESDAEFNVIGESHNTQMLELPKPDVIELEESSDDAGYEEVTISDDEEQDTRSVISRRSESANSSCSSTVSVHVCPYENCNKFFSRPFRLHQHVRTHTGERPYVCPSESCSKSYTRQQHLKRHIEVSHRANVTEEKFKCLMCDLMLSNALCLKKHILRHHATSKHKCSECGQTFAKQQQLQKHTYIHTGVKPFPCNYPDCEMRCLTLSRLKRHMLIHQKNRYACPEESCQGKFDTYGDLQHHIAADHPKVCDICSRPFRHLRSLRKHRLTHENTQEAYFCTYPACDRYYTQMNNLTAHIMQKHKQMKIYECGVCDKRLSSKQKLIHHMNNIHYGQSSTRNSVPKKPRKPRKDKGYTRLDYARLLSGYDGPEEGEDSSVGLEPEVIAEDGTDVVTCQSISAKLQTKERTGDDNESRDRVTETEET